MGREIAARQILFRVERSRWKFSMRGDAKIIAFLVISQIGLTIGGIVFVLGQFNGSSTNSTTASVLFTVGAMVVPILYFAISSYWYTNFRAVRSATDAIIDDLLGAGIDVNALKAACRWAKKFDLELLHSYNKQWLIEELDEQLRISSSK